MLSFDLDTESKSDMSSKQLGGNVGFTHGGSVKSRSTDLKVVQIEVVSQAQGPVTSPSLGDVCRAPTRDDTGNPGLYF